MVILQMILIPCLILLSIMLLSHHISHTASNDHYTATQPPFKICPPKLVSKAAASAYFHSTKDAHCVWIYFINEAARELTGTVYKEDKTFQIDSRELTKIIQSQNKDGRHETAYILQHSSQDPHSSTHQLSCLRWGATFSAGSSPHLAQAPHPSSDASGRTARWWSPCPP